MATIESFSDIPSSQKFVLNTRIIYLHGGQIEIMITTWIQKKNYVLAIRENSDRKFIIHKT